MILTVTELKQRFNLRDYPCTIVGNGSLATMTVPDNNFRTGDYINVTGSTSYNGVQLVTRLNPTQVTFHTSASTTEQAIVKPWDDVLSKMISQVENNIKNTCDMEYGNTASASEVHDLKMDGIIYPKRGLLGDSDVSEIKLTRLNNFSDSSKYITLLPEDYYIYEDRVELRFDKCVNYLNCKKAVKITYATQACPDGLKSIAIQMCDYYFRVWNDKSIADSSRSTNGDQVVFAKTLPQYIRDELQKYQRVGIGDPY